MPSLLDPLPRFIAQLLAILVVARLVGLVARRFGQPMVVAEIIAGILLGPSVLGLLLPELSSTLFAPDSLELLAVVSKLGLILFMFFVGLEFDLGRSRGRDRLVQALLVSQASFVIPLGLGLLLALQLHATLAEPGTSRLGLGLFVAAVLSTTAFPVLARILAERRLLRSRVGALAIAAAAIDDVQAWCLLAFVVAWARADGLAAAGLTSLLALVYVATMVLIVRPLLARWARTITSSELGHDHIALVMVLLFASAGATELIGIHALFGAFSLGAILPREGGLAHALVDKLEDFVVVVLMPLFFAYSGVRTQLGLLDSSGAWLTCLLVIAVACVGKLGAATLAARLGGLGWREASAIGVLMNTRGMIVLIMLNLGLDLGLVSPTLFTMLVIMALFTTLLATPVLDRVYPIGQHVADLLANETAEPTPELEPRGEAFTLLVCAEGQASRGLLLLASVLADADPSVHLHALQLRRPEAGEASTPAVAWPGKGALKQLSFVSSEPARDICRVAAAKAAALVVLERGRPHAGELVGETASHVLAQCSSDVAILFDAGLDRVARVLVVDAPGRDAAVQAVGERLRAAGAELHSERAEQLARRGGRRVDLVVFGLSSGAPEPATLDACLDLHARGISLLLIRGT